MTKSTYLQHCNALISAYGKICSQTGEITEKAFEIYEIKPIASADTIAYTKKDNLPLISEVAYKTGKVSLITIPYGLNASNLSNADYIFDGDTTEKNISMPYDYLNSVKKYIGKCIDKEKIIEVDNEQLQYSINICKDDNILLSVVNNGGNTENFVVRTNTGTITGIEEIHIPQISRDTTGYYAADKKAEDNGCVEEGKLNIEPKDIKLYKINLKEQYFDKKAEIKINDLSKNNYIALWKTTSIKEEILFNPTLKHHFAGIKVDARYLADRDSNALKKEAEYVKRQNVDIIIDFSSMINHFPGITLLDVKTSKYSEYSRYKESITTIKSIFEKVQLFGCDKAVFISQRNADFGALSIPQAVEMLAKSMEEICKLAKVYNITVYLQNGIGGMILDSAEFVKIGAVPTLVKKRDRIENVLDFIRNLNIENLKFALNTCHGIITTGEDVIEIVKSNKNRIGALLISSPYCDDFGQKYNLHSKIFNSKFKETVKNICISVKESENVDFVCLDGVYSNWSEAYLDSRELRNLSLNI